MFLKILVRISSRRRSLNKATNKATNWSVFSLGCLFLILVTSCSTSRHVPVQIVEQTKHDTCYIAQVHYDSIYIDRFAQVQKVQGVQEVQGVRVDTLIKELTKYEYKYKLLRDTIRIHEVDSIPVIQTVVETKEVRYIPPWIKTLAWIGAICILLIITAIIIKLAKL